MKNLMKLWALAALIGFLAACPTDGGGGGNPGFWGDTLTLSGQVYTMTMDMNPLSPSVTFDEFTGDLEIDDYCGGEGEIRGGMLSYSIGTPDSEYLQTLDPEYIVLSDYENLRVSNEDVKGVILYSLPVDDDDYYGLSRRNISINSRSTPITGTSEQVAYVYVEEDLTVSGQGTTETDTDTTMIGNFLVTMTYTYITKNFNLALKAGWNAVYIKELTSAKYTVTDPISADITMTETISLGNPSTLKWVMEAAGSDAESFAPVPKQGSMSNAPEIALKMLEWIRRNR